MRDINTEFMDQTDIREEEARRLEEKNAEEENYLQQQTDKPKRRKRKNAGMWIGLGLSLFVMIVIGIIILWRLYQFSRSSNDNNYLDPRLNTCGTMFDCDGGIFTKVCYKKKSKKMHPDKGGDEEMMKLLNYCNGVMEEQPIMVT